MGSKCISCYYLTRTCGLSTHRIPGSSVCFKRRSGVLPGGAESFDLGRAMAGLGFVKSKLCFRALPDSLACVGTLVLMVKEMMKCRGRGWEALSFSCWLPTSASSPKETVVCLKERKQDSRSRKPEPVTFASCDYD